MQSCMNPQAYVALEKLGYEIGKAKDGVKRSPHHTMILISRSYVDLAPRLRKPSLRDIYFPALFCARAITRRHIPKRGRKPQPYDRLTSHLTLAPVSTRKV